MSERLKKFLVIFASLAICGVVIAWSFVLNFGKIEITANQPFQIEGLGKTTIFCEKTCLAKAPIGDFVVTFKAEGFKPIQAQIRINRLQTTPGNLNFEYQPILLSSVLPEKKLAPDLPFLREKNLTPIWDKNLQNAVFLQKNGEKTELMLWQQNTEKLSKITNFYNLNQAEIVWGNTGKKLIIKSETSVYLVDLEQKLKYGITPEQNQNLQFSPSDTQILGRGEQFFLYDLKTQTSAFLNLTETPKNLIWKNETALIYTLQTEQKTEFYEYDLKTQNTSLIFSTEEPLSPQNLQISSNTQSLIFEAGEKAYELKLVD